MIGAHKPGTNMAYSSPRCRIVYLIEAVVLLIACALSPADAQSSPSHAQQQSLPDAPSAVIQQQKPQASPGRTSTEQHVDAPWPREAVRGDERIFMYQPQLETWTDDQLHAYAALSIERKGNSKPNYGVVWFTAQTEVDKVNRQVTLDNFQITKVHLPTLHSKEAEYLTFLQARLPGKSRVIALDRLETMLAASTSGQEETKGVPVSNDPPRVIFTTKPSLLVLIDGPPKFRDVGGTAFQKILNSQAFILLDIKKGEYYLNVMDGWLEASALDGPWSYLSKIPGDMKEITKAIQGDSKRRRLKAPLRPHCSSRKKKERFQQST
jgi:hypothetical protein